MKQAEPYFTTHLMHWHSTANKRIMPWKGEKNPYKVWLSEIILQQTRVAQGLVYYEKFIKAFPTVCSLAHASDSDVFKLWEGLGYYSRCKNLLATARTICKDHNGNFPANYDLLLQLKGVGPYTAAAIASFAFNLPYAVLDGNVFRVLSRFTGKSVPIDSTTGKKFFGDLAQKLLPHDQPAAYNQAIMDFGAVVCMPQNPLCETCPLNSKCFAFKTGTTDKLPVKEKGIVTRDRSFTFFVFRINKDWLIRKRIQKDIWHNLHEFYLLETDGITKWNGRTIKKFLLEELAITSYNIIQWPTVYTQKLTHQNLHGQFIVIHLDNLTPALSGFEKVSGSQLRQRAFPRMITRFFDTHPELFC